MMKRTTLAVLAAGLLVITPFSHAAQQEASTHENGKTTTREVKQDVSKAAESIKNYSTEKRDEAAKNAKAALDALDVRIAAMEARIDKNWDKMSQSARAEAQNTLKALHKQRIEAAEWYGGLKNSNADAWEHVKKGFSDAYQSLQHALEKAQGDFEKDKKQ